MTSMNDAAKALKHTSQGSRVGTNQQQTRGSQNQSRQGKQGENPTHGQSRQGSLQDQNLNQSRQRSQQNHDLNQSRQNHDLNQSRQRSQQNHDLNQSRQRSQQNHDLNQSRQQTSRQEPNLNQSRSHHVGDEGITSRHGSQRLPSQLDARSRQRTQEGLGTQNRNRSVMQSAGGWSNREDLLPQPDEYQQVVTPHSQRPSRRGGGSTRPSQVSQANGSRRSVAPSYREEDEDEYDEDEEDEDEESDNGDFVDYYPEYAPPPSVKRKGARVETADNYETCSCFPKRKNKNIPSMVYENITCVHNGLKGQSHAGVYRFDDNWIERDVQTANEQNVSGKKGKKKQKTINRPKIKYIYGYPKPVLPAVSDEEEENDADDDDEYYDEDMSDEDVDALSTRSKNQARSQSSKNKEKASKKRKHKQRDNLGSRVEEMEDDYDDDEDDEENPQGALTREEAYYPVALPQIGHSPPPSREKSRYSTRSQNALPPLPESPFIIANKNKKASIKPTQSVRSNRRDPSVSYQSGRHSAPDMRSLPSPRQQKPITKTRRFQGVYFDPVRKRAVPYDISWNGHLDQNGGRMSSRMPNRMRSSSRYSKTDIPEEDDDYYDEDDDDEDYEYADNR
uniref:Uncharacterized protein n=2 Tax=Magallana gigas TaxID=29159 RepID=A0A8W8K4K1_MAGGI